MLIWDWVPISPILPHLITSPILTPPNTNWFGRTGIQAIKAFKFCTKTTARRSIELHATGFLERVWLWQRHRVVNLNPESSVLLNNQNVFLVCLLPMKRDHHHHHRHRNLTKWHSKTKRTQQTRVTVVSLTACHTTHWLSILLKTVLLAHLWLLISLPFYLCLSLMESLHVCADICLPLFLFFFLKSLF